MDPILRLSRDSSVGIATWYELDDQSSMSARTIACSLSLAQCPESLWESPSLLYTGHQWFLPEAKRLEGKADNAPPSGTELRIHGAIPLLINHRNSFTSSVHTS
jgi:hypothetical protein